MRSICCLLLCFAAASAGDNSWTEHFHKGELLEREGNLARASTEFEIALREGSTDTELPLTLHNLGAVYRKMGRVNDAERCYVRAIELWTKQRPMELAGTLNNLAA